MKDKDETAGSNVGLHGLRPALQVIFLGSGGGPSEENVTGFLVHSVASDWAEGSLLAVDAGSHLAAITRILERDFPHVGLDNCRVSSRDNGNGVQTPELGKPPECTPLSSSFRVDVDVDEPPAKPEPTTVKLKVLFPA